MASCRGVGCVCFLYICSDNFPVLVFGHGVYGGWCNPKTSQAGIWSGHPQTSEEVAPVRFSEICHD